MKRKRHLWVILLFLLAGPIRAHATTDCTPQELNELLSADINFGDWQSFYDFYKKYYPCGDDGAIAEGYSDEVVKLLTAHWDQIDKFNTLVSQHSDFKIFVLKHLDELMSPDQSDKLRFLATSQCPRADTSLCQAIVKTLDDLHIDTTGSTNHESEWGTRREISLHTGLHRL